jgi:glyoxylase-like metal-dependent hydrolase (beta-lactamase superfamily II)
VVKILDLCFQNQPETIAAFLIETDKGPALVETGPHSTFPALREGLRKFGYEPEDVRHVFLTHIHLDHGGAAWVFAQHGATIYLHPAGKPHFEHPEKLLDSARRIYKDDMDRLWGDVRPIPSERMVAVDHHQKIILGDVDFRALHTPGHAAHHIAWQLDHVLFTGDVAGVSIGDKGIVMPPCPPPDINIEVWLDSIQLIRNKRFRSFYLTHFGKVTAVKEHLLELEGRLHNWANWMEPYFNDGAQTAEVVPLFQDYVRKQLEAAGITGQELLKYESANPSWMSVAGLMRYWKKKKESTGEV